MTRCYTLFMVICLFDVEAHLLACYEMFIEEILYESKKKIDYTKCLCVIGQIYIHLLSMSRTGKQATFLFYLTKHNMSEVPITEFESY